MDFLVGHSLDIPPEVVPHRAKLHCRLAINVPAISGPCEVGRDRDKRHSSLCTQALYPAIATLVTGIDY